MKCACGKVHALDELTPAERELEIARHITEGLREVIRGMRCRASSIDTHDGELISAVLLSIAGGVLADQLRAAAALSAIRSLMATHPGSITSLEIARSHPAYLKLEQSALAGYLAIVFDSIGADVGARVRRVQVGTEQPS